MNATPDDAAFVNLNRDDLLGALVHLALSEDVGSGDFTSRWTIPADAVGEAVIVAKEPTVVAGVDAAQRVFHTVDEGLELIVRRGDGALAIREQVILEIRGRLRSILTAERAALNFLAHLSGIATLTRDFVDAVAGSRARIVDTRKTTPGLRFLEKAAVRAGGGMNHRMGLYDMVLVKDNHIAAAGGIGEALAAVGEHNAPGLPVEVEVSSLRQLSAALKNPPDRILLDNMSVREMEEAVHRVSTLGGERPELEASGNVTLDRVAAIAGTGVDLISVGALTHSAPAADLSLRILG